MDFFEGLDKFGLDTEGMDGINIFEDPVVPEEESQTEEKAKDKGTDEYMPPSEEEYLLEKRVKCTVCEKEFREKAVKSSRLRRLQPEKDLRPRFQGVDTLKYDVISCPFCGYTAMSKYFPRLTSIQRKLIEEKISSKFKPVDEEPKLVYSYDVAIDRYRLALFNTMTKNGPVSEKAYTCLRIAWLYRGKADELIRVELDEQAPVVKECRENEEKYYRQAYEGLVKAMSTEPYPICGMDMNTLDVLLATMAVNMKEYSQASRTVARILTSPSAGKRAKDMALDLKDEILKAIKAGVK